VHLDLELRMVVRDAFEEHVERRRLLAGEEGQDCARSTAP
jgi:hypothetical protein